MKGFILNSRPRKLIWAMQDLISSAVMLNQFCIFQIIYQILFRCGFWKIFKHLHWMILAASNTLGWGYVLNFCCVYSIRLWHNMQHFEMAKVFWCISIANFMVEIGFLHLQFCSFEYNVKSVASTRYSDE